MIIFIILSDSMRLDEGFPAHLFTVNDAARLPRVSGGGLVKNFRQRPTLPHSFPCSTIGAEELNFRVRDGNGCCLFAIATEKSFMQIGAIWIVESVLIFMSVILWPSRTTD